MQNDNELGELRELQQSLAAAEKRVSWQHVGMQNSAMQRFSTQQIASEAETLSSGVRQIAEQMGATPAGS